MKISIHIQKVINGGLCDYAYIPIKTVDTCSTDLDHIVKLCVHLLEQPDPYIEYRAQIFAPHRLGTVYANGEFYPSSEYDNDPEYLNK